MQIAKRRIFAHLGTAMFAEVIDSRVSHTAQTKDAKVWINCIDNVRSVDGLTVILVV